jgi:hypothetical protein
MFINLFLAGIGQTKFGLRFGDFFTSILSSNPLIPANVLFSIDHRIGLEGNPGEPEMIAVDDRR